MEGEKVIEAFISAYGYSPTLVSRAPGRVNLIGEHTDYNEGFVLPIAINRAIFCAGAVRQDQLVRVRSLNFPGEARFTLEDLEHNSPLEGFARYIQGIFWVLLEAGYPLRGADLYIGGDVPVGSGLSSSAALEVAVAFALQSLFDLDIEGAQLALLCQKAENQYVGVKCGIMDQFISRLAQANYALLIDCRTLQWDAVPFPSEKVQIIIMDTGKRRGLLDSEYNRRREECERAVKALQTEYPQIRALRDATLEQLERLADHLPSAVFRRARHVISENDRTLATSALLRLGDLQLVGQRMNASHESLRSDYEVSCSELDIMVEEARAIPGVLGARMTGAGFGGCAIALAEETAVPEILEKVPARYSARTGLKPTFYVTRAEAGAKVFYLEKNP